jgi:hypothetical protein
MPLAARLHFGKRLKRKRGGFIEINTRQAYHIALMLCTALLYHHKRHMYYADFCYS